jgi:hypothetical protein
MKIIRHYCPYSTEEFFQVTPGPGDNTLNINRVKGEDYFIELYDKEGKIIISCNYPVTMHTRIFDLANWKEDEFMLRISKGNGVGVCMYRLCM